MTLEPLESLEPFEFLDPGELVRAVVREHTLQPGDAYLVLVEEPSKRQIVRRVVKLDVVEDDDGEDLRQVLCDEMQEIGAPEWSRHTKIRHAVMTIVVRRGMTVFGPTESRWFYGWRYSNHLAHAFTGDVTLVTEHGWADFMTGLGGHEPRLHLPARV